MIIPNMLEATTSLSPSRTAVVHGSHRMSYAELNSSSARLAAGLVHLGVERHERVAILFPHRPDWLVAFFGILKAGGIPVIPNPMLTGPELAAVLQDSDSKVLLCDERFSRTLGPHLSSIRALKHVVESDGEQFSSLPGQGPPLPPLEQDDTAPAVIVYALGILGRQKGIVHSHRSLVAATNLLISATEQTDRDVLVDPIPFFYLLGLCIGALVPLRCGSTIVIIPRFTPTAVAEAVSKEGGTLMVGVPAMYEALLGVREEAPDATLYGLRAAFTGGARTPPSLTRSLEQRCSTVLCDVYGLSEHLLVSLSTIHHRKLGTAGRPVCELRIVDDDGTELPQGEIGEAVVRGKWTMEGYYNAPELTAQVLRDGWLHTGDLVRLDQDGYLEYIKKKSSIIVTSAATKIQPTEVETVLLKHPAVAQVSYVGVESRGGEVLPTVYVVPQRGQRATSRELRSFCWGKVAQYKLPRRIEIVDSIPKAP